MEIIKYLLASTVLISISYLVFRLAYRNGTRFRQQRFFLIAALVLSLILPLTGIKIQTSQKLEKGIVTTGETGSAGSGYLINILASERQGDLSRATDTALKLYLIITGIIISVFAAHFIRILRLKHSSVKKQHDRFAIIISPNVESPFSFFQWIFIPKDIEDREEIESIIIHESVHVTQHHSADNLLIGFTAALMWFNPLIWMMKNSFHLIHEYLADEGTIGSGIDRLRYQAFLINHVAEERLILVSSGFSQSLIKKRMIMMTRDKNKLQKKVRILVMIPLSLFLISTTGFINGIFPGEAAARPIPGAELIKFQSPVTESQVVYKQDTSATRKVTVIRSVGQHNKGKKEEKIEIIGYGNQKNADTVIYVTGEKKPEKFEGIKIIGYGHPEGTDTVIYVVDGKKVIDISSLSPDSIESISVFKKDNMIILNTKKQVSRVIVVDQGKGPDEVDEKVLYIIDGNESDDKDIIKALDVSEIESITVHKDKVKIKELGKEGYDGIITITTKEK